MAVLVALMAMVLMSALGAAVVMTTSIETAIAARFRDAQKGRYAADAALEVAMAELAAVPDWTPVLDGSAPSPLGQAAPDAGRTDDDGAPLEVDRIVNMLNCRRPTACDAASLAAITSQRPWGANNPVWQLYAYGPLSTLLGGADPASAEYVIVLVADDPAENDGDPRRDGIAETNPGRGVVLVRAEAFGRGVHQIVEATLARSTTEEAPGIHVLSWRLLR